jgi:hypothetical protein
MWGDLHEEKSLEIALPTRVNAGAGNRKLREIGATLYYDVYAFDAPDAREWQSETLLDLDLFLDESEVDAQEDFNRIVAKYPFASRPSSDQAIAIELVYQIADSFDATVRYNGVPMSPRDVQADWDTCSDYLMKEWGEEPGSQELARMIHENCSQTDYSPS